MINIHINASEEYAIQLLARIRRMLLSEGPPLSKADVTCDEVEEAAPAPDPDPDPDPDPEPEAAEAETEASPPPKKKANKKKG